MKLPRFLRHWAAMYLVLTTPETGGVLHDYANGRWKELTRWGTQEGANEALGLTDDMVNNWRDNVYVAMITCNGSGNGYFLVCDSNSNVYCRYFWLGVYNPDEAMSDVSVRCRKIADKMGYRRVNEETNN